MPIALNNRGSILAELNLLEDALASYDRAIAFKPDYAEAVNTTGAYALHQIKRFDEALASCDPRAIALNPEFPEAFKQSRQCPEGSQSVPTRRCRATTRAIALKLDYAGRLQQPRQRPQGAQASRRSIDKLRAGPRGRP